MPTTLRKAGMLWVGMLVLGVLLSASAQPVHAMPPAAPPEQTISNPVFGANFVSPEEPWMGLALNGGIRTVRVQINWQDIERSPGNYSWDWTDRHVVPLIEKGFVIHAVLTLPPDWARSGGGYMPASMNDFARWTGIVADHYRGRIDTYEVWNEPDLDIYWNGSPAQYVQMLKASYPAIKANDPNATVVMAGMAIFAERGFFPEVLRLIAASSDAAANNHYFDAANLHLYSDPDLLYDELLKARNLLDLYGMGHKPIWLTETNAPLCCVDGGPAHGTPGYANNEEAGYFVIQAFANALALDVERLIIYRFHDADQRPRHGIVANDQSPRPAYTAFRTASRHMATATSATRHISNGATIVTITKQGGDRVHVAWANGSATTASITSGHSQATLVDWQGNTSTVSPQNGAYVLSLSGATNSQVGGPPLMILEEGDATPPYVIVTRLPDWTDGGNQLALSWSADDGDGTGVASFDVEVSHDDGPWLTWLDRTRDTAALYDVAAGGKFRFRVRARDAAGNLSTFVEANPLGTRTPGASTVAITSNFTSLPPVETNDLFFGANFVPPEEPWMTLAWEAGVRTVRVQINWQDIERNPGFYTWSYTDQQVLPLVERGFDVVAILTLPPDFRRVSPDSYVPDNLYLQWNEDGNNWGDWVFNVAEHYKGKIDHYEIWNEPDIDIYWNGSSDDYAELLRSAYQAIAAGDPDTTVVMAGMALREDLTFMDRTLDYIVNFDEQAPLNNYFFDVAAIHVYSEVDLLFRETLEARQMLDGHGLDNRPIWLTETNVPLWGEGSGPQTWESGYASPEESGWFMVQMMATARAAGIERVMVYRFSDVGEPIAYGMLRADQSERPTYVAFKTAATFFSDVSHANWNQSPEATVVQMQKNNGGLVTALWANTGAGATVTLDASAPAGLFANADGAVWAAQPNENGQYVINLDPATNIDLTRFETHFFGGPPVILVEDDRTAPVVTLDPVQTDFDQRTFSLGWSGDDGPLGTGTTTYDVQFSRQGEEVWQDWLLDTTQTEAVFDGSDGGGYIFRVRARDRAGNTGPFTQNVEEPVFIGGLLVAQVVNLRGEPVPDAAVTLKDGRKFTTDSRGRVTIPALQDNVIAVGLIDGGPQGEAFPPPVNTSSTGDDTSVTWMLVPKDNQIFNGFFDADLAGWDYTLNTEGDVTILLDGGNRALQLAGQRRPWGSPSVSVELQIPRQLDNALLGFRYRLPFEGQTLHVIVRQHGGRNQPDILSNLWVAEGTSGDWTPVALNMSAFEGQRVTITFMLYGPKGSPPGLALIDDVALGSLPD